MRSRLSFVAAGCLALSGAVGAASAPAPGVPRSLPRRDQNRILGLQAARAGAGALEAVSRTWRENPRDPVLIDLAAMIFVQNRARSRGLALCDSLAGDSTAAPAALFHGVALYIDREPEAAVPFLRRAADGYREARDGPGLLIALTRLGGGLNRLHRYPEAREALEEGWSLGAPGGLVHYRIECGDLLSTVVASLGDRDSALALDEAALELVRQTDDPLLSRILNNIAYLKERSGEFQASRSFYHRAAALALAEGDSAGYLRRTDREAEMAERLGDISGALELEGSARDLARSLGLRDEEARFVLSMAAAHRHAGDPAGAVSLADTVLAFAGEPGIDSQVLFRAAGIKGNALFDLGRILEAREAHEESRKWLPASRPLYEAGVLNNLGNVLVALGEVEEGLDHYRRALAVAVEQHDEPRRAIYLANIASALDNLGRYEEAIETFAEASAVFEASGDYVNFAHTLLDQALIHLRLGNDDTAEALVTRALRRLEAEGIRSRIAGCRIALAAVHRRRGEPEAARRELTRALALARETGSADEELRALAALAGLDLARGDTDGVRSWCARALNLDLTREGAPYRARFETLLGEAARRSGDLSGAAAHHREALRALIPAAEPEEAVDAHLGLARDLRASGDRRGALRAYREAIAVIETLRRGAGAERERWSVFAGYAPAYAEAAGVTAALAAGPEPDSRPEDAFALAEMARARTFLDRLEAEGVDLDRRLPPALRDERRENLQRYGSAHARLQTALARGDTTAATALIGEMGRLDREYARIEGRIHLSRAPLGDPRAFTPASPAEVAAHLPPGSVLLEYLDTGDGLLVFRVTAAGGLRVIRVDECREPALALRRSLESSRSPRAFDAAGFAHLARRVYLAAVAPALADLKSPPSLLVVAPDGPLRRVPFETLFTADTAEGTPESELPYLFRAMPVVYEPSATAFVRLAERRSSRPVPGAGETLVLADPTYPGPESGDPARGTAGNGSPGGGANDAPSLPAAAGSWSLDQAIPARYGSLAYHFAPLPNAEAEAGSIASALGPPHVRIFRGSEASEDRFKREASRRWRNIHLAAHSIIDDQHPSTSAIVLALDDDPAEDGFLTLREVYDLDLDARLVVLSSCRSASGPDIPGEGVIALARAFLAAGAGQTAVTLWAVNDRSTAAFMNAFYRALASGTPAPRALGAAREAMLASPRPAWRLPYHWAPFVVVGGGR